MFPWTMYIHGYRELIAFSFMYILALDEFYLEKMTHKFVYFNLSNMKEPYGKASLR